jgi:DNA-directed RNA polymerase alpha subunit
MTMTYVFHQHAKEKIRKTLIYQTQYALRDFDVDGLKQLSKWLNRQIKLMETDITKYKKTLEDLGLSNRAYNVLKNNGIDTIQKLHQKSLKEDNIRLLKGAGNQVTKEIMEKIRAFHNTYIFKMKG